MTSDSNQYQNLPSSDSDSDPESNHLTPDEKLKLQRTEYLSTIGLIQRPLTREYQALPTLPPHRNSSPSIFPTQDSPPTDRNSSVRFQERQHDLLEDPLSKMEVAFAKYLGIEPPVRSESSFTRSTRSSYPSHQSRTPSKSLSGRGPSSEDLKASTSNSQHNLLRYRPQSAESCLPSTGNGFRAWFNGVSKSVSNMSPRLSSDNPLPSVHQRHRSSISVLRSFANPPSELSRLSVSGPIDSFNPHFDSRSPSTSGPSSLIPNSPKFNSGRYAETRTWSGSIDPTTLSKYPEKEKNRQEAIFELITTEATFVKNCHILSHTFYLDLEPLIGSRAASRIFSNIEDIMMFGTTFLSALERRQMESGYHVTHIGDIVSVYMRRVDIFTPYCSNQANASRLLNHLKQEPAVSNRLNGLTVNGLEIEHYLLQPMQRLTRYPLLIAQIIKYTDENSSEFECLSRALKNVQQVLTTINETIRKKEDHFRLLSLSEKLMIPGSDVKLSLATITRFVGPRRLIREGLVIKSRSKKILHAYLFNDFFLLTKSPSQSGLLDMSQSQRNDAELMYRAPMALEQCQFLPGKDEQSFIVYHGSENFAFKVNEGSKICTAWLEDFKHARNEVLKALAASKSKRATWAIEDSRRKNSEKPSEDLRRQKIIEHNDYDYDKKENRGKEKSSESLSITPQTSFGQFMENPSTSMLSSLNKKSIRMPM